MFTHIYINIYIYIYLVVFGNSCEFFLRFTRHETSTFQGNVFFTFHLPHPKRFFYVSCWAGKRFFYVSRCPGENVFFTFQLARHRRLSQGQRPRPVECSHSHHLPGSRQCRAPAQRDRAGPLPKGTPAFWHRAKKIW